MDIDLIDISLAIIAIAFAVLVVYLVMTLMSAMKTLKQVNETVSRMQGQVQQLSTESTRLIQSGNQITQDVQTKLDMLNPLFHSFDNFGQTVNQVSSTVKTTSQRINSQVTVGVEEAVEKNRQQIPEIMRYATLAMQLWQRWKASKREAAMISPAQPAKGESRDQHVLSGSYTNTTQLTTKGEERHVQ